MITTSRKPRRIASLRLSMAVWMKFSCWNIVASNWMLGRLGSSVLTTSSTSRVSSTVSAHGSFSTMSIRPRPSLTAPSPSSGWWSSTTSATSPSRTTRAGLPGVLRRRVRAGPGADRLDRHLRQVVGRDDGQHGAHVEPLVRRLDDAAGADDRALVVQQQPGVHRLRGGLHHLVQADVAAAPWRPAGPAPAASAAARPTGSRWPRRAPGAAGRAPSSRRSSTSG